MYNSDLRLLFLGDSYTVGFGGPIDKSWPMQLVRRLEAKTKKQFEARLIAENGWTTVDLLAGVKRANLAGEYRLVFLLIGANNHFSGGNIYNYITDFKAIVENVLKLVDRDAGRLILISIPDWGATPFAIMYNRQKINAGIDRFNQVVFSISREYGARYIDIAPLTRQLSSDESMLVGDNLHPSALMYKEWLNLILPETMSALKAG